MASDFDYSQDFIFAFMDPEREQFLSVCIFPKFNEKRKKDKKKYEDQITQYFIKYGAEKSHILYKPTDKTIELLSSKDWNIGGQTLIYLFLRYCKNIDFQYAVAQNIEKEIIPKTIMGYQNFDKSPAILGLVIGLCSSENFFKFKFESESEFEIQRNVFGILWDFCADEYKCVPNIKGQTADYLWIKFYSRIIASRLTPS